MQINPHFLFNTLNVISVLVMKQDNAKAGEMIERLSVFFRQTLEESSEQYLPLQQELDVIDQYLAIEELRFGDRLQIRRNFDPEALSALVPVLILQPLVENAIRHGLGEKLDAGVLSLECKRVADRLLIRIIDDGVGCSFSTNTGFTPGIGLSNVQQRLQQMYGNDHVFNLSGETGQGVTVSIEIPFTRQDPGLAAQ
jgi:LytS/YehU family sensor histidine kinase